MGPDDRVVRIPHLVHGLDNVFDTIRPQNQVKEGHSPQHLLPFLLGEAARHPQNEVGVGLLERLQTPCQRVNFLFRLFPDRAGIDENQVSILHLPGTQVAGMEQKKLHPVRIRHIHLATVSIQIDLFHVERL